MKAQILKRNKLSSMPKHFICLDTEGFEEKKEIEKQSKICLDSKSFEKVKKTKEPQKTNFFKHILSFGYAFYSVNHNGDYYRDDELYFEDSKTLTYWILNKCKQNEPLYIFSHNTAYDFRLCINYNLFLEYGFELSFAVSDGNFIFKYTKRLDEKCICGCNNLSYKYENNKRVCRCKNCGKKLIRSRNFYSIIFLSTTNWFRTKLSVLGEIFGLKKIDFDFDDPNSVKEIIDKTDRAKEYCYRDVEVLEKVVLYLIDYMKDKCNFSMTIASMSFNIFRHKFYKENIIMHKNPSIEEFERKSYFGGRTECFRIGKYKNIYKLDINSMYPFIMRNNPYPICLKKYSPKASLSEIRSRTCISNIDIKINKPKIPYRANKLIFPVGEFNITLCKPELNLLSDDEIISINDTYFYETDYLFTEFVDYFYNLRMKHKKAGKSALEYMDKIVLNSLYGKFAQRKRSEKRNKKYDGILQNGYTDLVDQDYGIVKTLKFINSEAYSVNKMNNGRNTFIPISAFVTSYARSIIWNMLDLVWENVYYCDTDSLFVNSDGLKILLDHGLIDNYELGKLKIEEKISNLELRNCKDYSYDNQHKIKGVKSNEVKKAVDNGEDISNKSEWIYKRFLGFNEALRYYNLEIGTIEDHKVLSRNYDKGKVVDNIVYPYKLPDDLNEVSIL
ncbi:MAG: DNA polymerase [Atribacterota bacterium]